MNALKISAIVLIVAGVIALAYGGFSYTRETHNVSMGPVEMSVSERETVNVPVWAGIAAVAAGGMLLLVGGRRS